MLLNLLVYTTFHFHSKAAKFVAICFCHRLVFVKIGVCLQGDLGTRRAKYEAQWHVFASLDKTQQIQYSDVPWLVEDLTEDKAQLTDFVLYGTTTVEERRRRSRSELMRWHPDKFTAKFGRRLNARDRQRILDKVNAMSQLLNSIGSGIV